LQQLTVNQSCCIDDKIYANEKYIVRKSIIINAKSKKHGNRERTKQREGQNMGGLFRGNNQKPYYAITIKAQNNSMSILTDTWNY